MDKKSQVSKRLGHGIEQALDKAALQRKVERLEKENEELLEQLEHMFNNPPSYQSYGYEAAIAEVIEYINNQNKNNE